MNPIHDKTTALTYAGVGARATPPDVLRIMTAMSEWLSIKGWHLASGGAQGGDSAFAQGAPPDKRTIYLPWQRYNGHHDPSCVPLTPSQLSACMDVAAPLHPAWNRCSTNVRRLHARNAAILLGPDLDRPVNAVVAWTKAGAVTGGTGMALRIAEKHGIPAFNLCTLVDDGKEARLFAGVPARGVVFGRRLCAAAVGTVTSAGFCSEVGR